VLINSFKSRKGIFGDPMALPTQRTFSLEGFEQVLERSNFEIYFGNSLTVTVVTLVIVLMTGAMAAWALSEYKFRGNLALASYLSLGIMIPIRLGSVSILQLVVDLGLINTLTALILVYTAQSLPLAVFILSEFMSQIPKDLKEAARCDGVGEYKIFYAIILPLSRPAIATVGVFSMIPIWNDLWFPLILAPGEETQTITLGVQQFVGQYVTNWNAVLASLTLAIIPVLVLYLIFSRQLVRGITSGAVK
jgi:raffinose/stachyose/melibiose transport system permease protein